MSFNKLKFCYLWHKRLSHIFKERLERLVKNEILPNLKFTDFNICVDCIKSKQTKHTKHTKKGAIKSKQLLEILYINICGHFDVHLSINKNILSLLLMTMHIMDISIYSMKNSKQ